MTGQTLVKSSYFARYTLNFTLSFSNIYEKVKIYKYEFIEFIIFNIGSKYGAKSDVKLNRLFYTALTVYEKYLWEIIITVL